MKAFAAMSGGVDSSVSAFLASKMGYEVAGGTMLLTPKNENDSQNEADDARRVCEKMGFEHIVLDMREEFREKIIQSFISSYENSRTPNPCVECNKYIKFGYLFDKARDMGFDAYVTGHYARIEKTGDRWALKKAVDEGRDQSYFLYSIKKEKLPYILFPLGEYTKNQVREIAVEQDFVTAGKHDSQDICFVPDRDYAGYIRRATGKEFEKGDFVNSDGIVLGRHNGIINYTIGQRKGLGIAVGEPVYVTKLLPCENKVVLGKNGDLFRRELIAENCNWIKYDIPPRFFRAKAKIRSCQREQWAEVALLAEGKIKVTFDEEQRAVTAGQAVVLYDEDEVIGGGTII